MIDKSIEKCNSLNSWECSNNFLHWKIDKDGNKVWYDCWKRAYLDCYWIREFSKELLNLTLNDINKTSDEEEIKLLKEIKNSCDNGKEVGYYLYGSTGIGKTFKTICLCNTLNKKFHKTISYVYVPKLIQTLKSNFDGNSKINDDIIWKCSNADIFVLDDIASEFSNKWFYLNYLLVILNNRAESNKKTIVISNLDIKSLYNVLKKNMQLQNGEEVMLDRLMSRLLKTCDNKIFTYDKKDMRIWKTM